MELDERLRQYGYKAEYSGPTVDDCLDSQPGVADAHANVACCMTDVRVLLCLLFTCRLYQFQHI